MTDDVLEKEFRETLDLLHDGSLSAEERKAACDALKGMAVARAELAKADTNKKADYIHAGVELLKVGAMIAGSVFAYKGAMLTYDAAMNSQALTMDIWKASLEADKLGEMITTSAGRNILSGRRP
jgi:hypothetical protein